MFKNKCSDGACNICGKNIARIRKSKIPAMSQRELADKMQLFGIDIDKNAVQRIESGKRFVTDLELIGFSSVLEVDIQTLLFE